MDDKTLKETKKVTLLLLIVAAVAFVIGAAFYALKRDVSLAVQGTPEQNDRAYYSSKPVPSQEMTGSSSEQSAASSKTKDRTFSSGDSWPYLVAVWENGLGVFAPGEAEPLLTLELDLSLLPEGDLHLLEQGIRVRDLAAAKAVLEDYE